MSAAKKPKLAAQSTVQSSSIFRIPEELLIHVFSHLDIHSLLHCSRTCRMWHRLSQDNTLWHNVDLKRCKLRPKSLWKVVRQRFGSHVTSVGLNADVRPTRTTRKLLTKPLMEEISSRCSDLRTFNLMNCDLRKFPFSLISAQCLKLQHCTLDGHWFVSASKRFPNLQSLDVTDSSMINCQDVLEISKLPHLVHINLTGCYRLNDAAIKVLCEKAVQLKSLVLSTCIQITDDSLHRIGRNLKNLKELHLQSLTRLTDTGLSAIANTMQKKLRVLNLSKCVKLTDQGVGEVGQKLIELAELDVSGCPHVTNKCIDSIRDLLPGCCVLSHT